VREAHLYQGADRRPAPDLTAKCRTSRRSSRWPPPGEVVARRRSFFSTASRRRG